MLDPHTKESRGFGFVNMVTAEQADAAKEGLQGEVIEGRTLSIEKARRARPRTPTPGKYFGPPKRGKLYHPFLLHLASAYISFLQMALVDPLVVLVVGEVVLAVTVTMTVVAPPVAAGVVAMMITPATVAMTLTMIAVIMAVTTDVTMAAVTTVVVVAVVAVTMAVAVNHAMTTDTVEVVTATVVAVMTVTAVMTVVEVVMILAAAAVVTTIATPTLLASMLPALPVRLATPMLAVVDVPTKGKHAAALAVLPAPAVAARIGTLVGKVSPLVF